MKIQNAPLTKELIERIQRFVIDMGNKMACCETTKIDSRTFNAILKREWASIETIEALTNYCNEVEQFNNNKVA